MLRLSPGILASSYLLLKKMHENDGFDILRWSQRNQSISGTKTTDVLDTLLGCEWAELIGGIVRLTPKGVQLAREFSIDTKRLMIEDYIKHAHDPWVTLIPRGRKECTSYLPSDVLACFNNAKLLMMPPADDVILWWDRQAQFVRGEQEMTMLGIGRVGEKLTVEYERKRTNAVPTWKSIESNLAGYDVLSILKCNSTIRLPIEVKASEKVIEIASAFITRLEWEVARTSPQYIFHFWLINGCAKSMAVLSPNEIENHLPRDAGAGEWQTAAIKFVTFSDKFVPIPDEN